MSDFNPTLVASVVVRSPINLTHAHSRTGIGRCGYLAHELIFWPSGAVMIVLEKPITKPLLHVFMHKIEGLVRKLLPRFIDLRERGAGR